MKHNSPDLWVQALPVKEQFRHKYNYGHALIYAAPELTGATRLAATACARVGAGLVTVLTTKDTADIYRTSLPPHILVRDDLGWWDDRITARLYGSGGLPTQPDYTKDIPTVLDADALQNLPDKLTPNYILTPHEGEFAKAFADIEGNKEEQAVKAAKKIGAHIVLKGPETIIAAPDGSYIKNTHATPDLATAGTGDVLAGLITGLTAQNMQPTEACAAATWIHGEAAKRIGIGLVASDIEKAVPEILKDLLG